MSKQILKDVGIFFGAKRIHSSLNQVAVEYEADAPEVTCFGDDTHKMLAGGLKTTAISAQGFYEAAEPDKTLFEAVGISDELISVIPSGAILGAAFMLRAVLGEYSPVGGSIGDPAGFSLNAGAFGALIRGILKHNAVETASADGAGSNLGTVSATQKLYAGIHVFDSSGDGSQTLDVSIESDLDDLWGTPTSRIDFTQFTTVAGFEAKELAGAITDDWWRVTWTIGGTGSPSFDFAVIIGIQ